MLGVEEKPEGCGCGGTCSAECGPTPEPDREPAVAVQTKSVAGSAGGGPGEAEADRLAGLAVGRSLSASPPPSYLSALRTMQGVAPGVQRAPLPETETADRPGPYGLIVDDATEVGPRQMRRTEFMDRLTQILVEACNEDLAAVGRDTEGCPVLERWLGYYQGRPAAHLERVIQRFARPDATNTADDLLAAVVARVRASIRYWAATGQLALPAGVDPAAGVGGGAGESEGEAAEEPQRKATSPGTPAPRMSPTAIQGQLGTGRPLDGGVRARLERGFGTGFGGVQVHTDTTAASLSRQLSARAFTVGNHIAFNRGEYRPGTLDGDLLIAHELAHTLQQQGAGPESLQAPAGKSFEDDADLAAVGAVASVMGLGPRFAPARRTGLALQGCTEVKKRCPPGYSWRVQRTTGLGSLGCLCHWKCLPGEPPRPSAGPAITCPPGMNCSTGVRYEDLGLDYEKTGPGAHMTPPPPAQAFCGCFPLNYEGEQVSDSPMRATDFEMTDIVGPLADRAARGRATNPRTGVREPSAPEPPSQRRSAPMTPPPSHVGEPPAPASPRPAPTAPQAPPTGTATPPARPPGGTPGTPTRPTTPTEEPPATRPPTPAPRPAPTSPQTPSPTVQDPFADLAAFRQRSGMPAAGSPQDVQHPHAATRLDIGGQSFYGRNAHGRTIDIRVNAQTRTHAEADAFQQAKDAGATGTTATLYVDRALCGSCGGSGGLGSLMRGIGVSELTVVTPEGRFRVTAARPSVPRPVE